MEFTVDRADPMRVLRQWFVRIAMGVLVATALLKLFSVASEARGLGASDPLFDFLTARQVLLLAAMFDRLALGLLVFMVAGSLWCGWSALKGQREPEPPEVRC